jgi:hypothetical protein
MESLILNYRANLEFICSLLTSSQGRSLTKLISLGLFDGATAWKLFYEYRDWGLLHLLILSGSQFYSFAKAWEFSIRSLQRTLFGKCSAEIAKWSLIPAGIIFLKSLNVSPPLVRCAFIWFVYCVFAPHVKRTSFLLFLAFALHLFIFENFEISNSAFLSWLAFLTLMAANFLFESYVAKTIFITTILQACICLIKEKPLLLQDFVIAGICNLLALPFFERCLFPMVGLVSAITLLLSVTWIEPLSGWIFKGFFAPLCASALDLMVTPLLVAHNAFRYTFSK